MGDAFVDVVPKGNGCEVLKGLGTVLSWNEGDEGGIKRVKDLAYGLRVFHCSKKIIP